MTYMVLSSPGLELGIFLFTISLEFEYWHFPQDNRASPVRLETVVSAIVLEVVEIDLAPGSYCWRTSLFKCQPTGRAQPTDHVSLRKRCCPLSQEEHLLIVHAPQALPVPPVPTSSLSDGLLGFDGLFLSGAAEIVQLLREGESQSAAAGQAGNEHFERHAGDSQPGRACGLQRQSLGLGGGQSQVGEGHLTPGLR